MFSTDRSGMRAVLEVLADEGLFFLDSRTSAGTVGYHVALEIDLAAAERQVFLDRDRAPEAIAKQFQELLDTAAARGQAIAIGHPYPETLAMLETEVPLARLGFDFVRLSRVVERPTG